jgi:hypothetical protein
MSHNGLLFSKAFLKGAKVGFITVFNILTMIFNVLASCLHNLSAFFALNAALVPVSIFFCQIPVFQYEKFENRNTMPGTVNAYCTVIEASYWYLCENEII